MIDGYKDSSLGEIPNDWEIGTINDFVISFKGGAALSPSDFVKENGFPVIPKKAIGKGGKLEIDLLNPTFCSISFSNNNKNNIIDKNYIVTTLRDLVPSGPSIGYMVQFQSEKQFILAQGVYGFKVNNNINREFLTQYSNTLQFRKVMQTIKVGSTQVHIRNKDYFGVQIPLPPLSEQQKIAEVLSTVDDKIEVIDQQIIETQALKKGLMQRLLTKGIAHTEFKDSPLGEIPKSWEVVTINSLGKVVTGSTPKTSVNEYYAKEGILWASPSDLTNVKYVNSTKKKLTPLGFKQTRKLPAKSILVTCIGSTIGKIGITNSCMSTNQQINSIVCSDLNDSEFYYYVIEKNADYIKSMAGTQAVPLLNKTDFSSILVIKPTLDEQKKIAEILGAVDDKLEVLSEKKTHYQELKQGLMQQLLTGKIRVKV